MLEKEQEHIAKWTQNKTMEIFVDWAPENILSTLDNFSWWVAEAGSPAWESMCCTWKVELKV